MNESAVVIKFQELVYVILGIDDDGFDQVISVCKCFDEARRYCVKYLLATEFHDVWIEKHALI